MASNVGIVEEEAVLRQRHHGEELCSPSMRVRSGSGRRERKERKDRNKPRRPLLEPMRTHHMDPCVRIQAWAAHPIADLGTHAYTYEASMQLRVPNGSEGKERVKPIMLCTDTPASIVAVPLQYVVHHGDYRQKCNEVLPVREAVLSTTTTKASPPERPPSTEMSFSEIYNKLCKAFSELLVPYDFMAERLVQSLEDKLTRIVLSVANKFSSGFPCVRKNEREIVVAEPKQVINVI
ncbi:hypothetical protein PIB30_023881 [Stylosanthes scabra]|uniref:Uncharacterized protein n=1 Tax=Stylosanthes scabra TaxID=79078 RepID=A0ABU6T9B3_9FABA|nr:hypothetical protein [Stylosanthes scabra]